MTTIVTAALPGSMFPVGATPMSGGTNFAVASGADAVRLCLFDDGIESQAETQVELTEYDAGVWHGFVPGVGPGQAYGYRMSGPWDPRRGGATTRRSSCSTRTRGPSAARCGSGRRCSVTSG